MRKSKCFIDVCDKDSPDEEDCPAFSFLLLFWVKSVHFWHFLQLLLSTMTQMEVCTGLVVQLWNHRFKKSKHILYSCPWKKLTSQCLYFHSSTCYLTNPLPSTSKVPALTNNCVSLHHVFIYCSGKWWHAWWTSAPPSVLTSHGTVATIIQ